MKPEITCFEREQLFAYVHDMLEPREEGKVRAHLTECYACREVVGEYHRLESALDQWKPTEPSPWFDARVRAALLSHPSRTLFGFEWGRWLAPALVTMIVVVASVVVFRSLGPLLGPDRGRGEITRTTNPGAPGTGTQSQLATRASHRERLVDDYDMLVNFDVLSELPKGDNQAVD